MRWHGLAEMLKRDWSVGWKHRPWCCWLCLGLTVLCTGRTLELWAVLWTSLGPLYVRPRAEPPPRQPVTLDIKTTFQTHIQAFGLKPSESLAGCKIVRYRTINRTWWPETHKGQEDCHPIYHLSRLINITEEDCGWVFGKKPSIHVRLHIHRKKMSRKEDYLRKLVAVKSETVKFKLKKWKKSRVRGKWHFSLRNGFVKRNQSEI